MFRAASSFFQECAATLANDGTNWTFIPPGAILGASGKQG